MLTRYYRVMSVEDKQAVTDKLSAAAAQGQAFEEALSVMKQMTEHQQQEVDDYLVTIAAEKAEGLYVLGENGELDWQIPEQGMNVHLEVVVQDKYDLRFIPGLTVHCEIKSKNGEKIGRNQQLFLWHPFLYHYGRNWQVPGSDEYTVTVEIKAPDFGRHDEVRGKRYAKPVSVSFDKFKLSTGRKEHGPE